MCGASIHGALKHGLVPPIVEVAMQREAGRVPGREYEPPIVVQLVKWVHGVPQFKEDGYEVNRMRGRADAVVDAIRVRHMGLVI